MLRFSFSKKIIRRSLAPPFAQKVTFASRLTACKVPFSSRFALYQLFAAAPAGADLFCLSSQKKRQFSLENCRFFFYSFLLLWIGNNGISLFASFSHYMIAIFSINERLNAYFLKKSPAFATRLSTNSQRFGLQRLFAGSRPRPEFPQVSFSQPFDSGETSQNYSSKVFRRSIYCNRYDLVQTAERTFAGKRRIMTMQLNFVRYWFVASSQ